MIRQFVTSVSAAMMHTACAAKDYLGGDGHYDSIATTTDVRDKVISARLIKYQ